MAGGEADGTDDRRNFLGEEMKMGIRKKRRKKNETEAHACRCTHFTLLLLYFAAVSASRRNDIYVGAHEHIVHMPSIIRLSDALALRLTGRLESVTAYNMKMIEMSLSRNGL